MPVVRVPNQKDQLYPLASKNEALWAVLRAHRHATCSGSLNANGKFDTQMSRRRNALQPPVPDDVHAVSGHETPGMAREPIVDATGSRTVGIPDGAKHEAERAPHTRAPTVLTVGKRQQHLGVRMATRTRLVANARPWDAWSDLDQRLAPQRLPLNIVSNIIVLGQGKQRPPDGERPPGADPSDGTFRAALNGGQQLRARIKSFEPEVSFEAKRQLIALAEALARQAAREDEAAERPRSPPDVPVENSPGRDANEDTS